MLRRKPSRGERKLQEQKSRIARFHPFSFKFSFRILIYTPACNVFLTSCGDLLISWWCLLHLVSLIINWPCDTQNMTSVWTRVSSISILILVNVFTFTENNFGVVDIFYTFIYFLFSLGKPQKNPFFSGPTTKSWGGVKTFPLFLTASLVTFSKKRSKKNSSIRLL